MMNWGASNAESVLHRRTAWISVAQTMGGVRLSQWGGGASLSPCGPEQEPAQKAPLKAPDANAKLRVPIHRLEREPEPDRIPQKTVDHKQKPATRLNWHHLSPAPLFHFNSQQTRFPIQLSSTQLNSNTPRHNSTQLHCLVGTGSRPFLPKSTPPFLPFRDATHPNLTAGSTQITSNASSTHPRARALTPPNRGIPPHTIGYGGVGPQGPAGKGAGREGNLEGARTVLAPQSVEKAHRVGVGG